jgi:predicted DNA-binding ribbon-helix-helix protein
MGGRKNMGEWWERNKCTKRIMGMRKGTKIRNHFYDRLKLLIAKRLLKKEGICPDY